MLGIGLFVISTSFVLADTQSDQNAKRLRFQKDKATCASGHLTQAYENCMREAKASFAERESRVAPPTADELRANSLERCNAFGQSDRLICIARIEGKGSISGSVDSGGIYRELIVLEPELPTSQ